MALAEPHIKSGPVGSLRVMCKQPLARFPDTPTSWTLGVNDLHETAFWLGLHAPKGTPKPIVDKVQELLVATYKVDALRERIIASGQRPIASTPAAFTARLESDLKLYGEIFKAANIKIEQ